MAKLKTLQGRVGTLPSKLKHVSAASGADRDRTIDWRKWYRTARWKRLRLSVFARDGYICQHTGVRLIGKPPAANSPVAHHKTPHRGDPALFWNIDNLETVSKGWHDTVAQTEERAAAVGRGARGGGEARRGPGGKV